MYYAQKSTIAALTPHADTIGLTIQLSTQTRNSVTKGASSSPAKA